MHKKLFGDVLEAVDASLPMVKLVVAFGVVVTLATAIAVVSVIAVDELSGMTTIVTKMCRTGIQNAG